MVQNSIAWNRAQIGPPACPLTQYPRKHAKWLHELMTKGAASMNPAYCMDTEEEDKRCVIGVQCDGMADAA
jgi:hypothetical protein